MSQKSGFLIVSNGFVIENVGHTLTKNYNGTYWPLIQMNILMDGIWLQRIDNRSYHKLDT